MTPFPLLGHLSEASRPTPTSLDGKSAALGQSTAPYSLDFTADVTPGAEEGPIGDRLDCASPQSARPRSSPWIWFPRAFAESRFLHSLCSAPPALQLTSAPSLVLKAGYAFSLPTNTF